jgi:hypothetical protein
LGVPATDLQSGILCHVYAVTSQHTAPQGASVIRINTQNGKSRKIDLEPDEWHFVQGGADISAVDLTSQLDGATDAVSYIPLGLWGSKDFIETVSLAPGEDGFMLGLFADHPGKTKNIIAARFGNLSMIASDDAPIKQPNGAIRPSHIFDMRSRGGFSGSPVFVYRTPEGDLRELNFGVRRKTFHTPMPFGGQQKNSPPMFEHDADNNMFVSLLGIHAGQYPEPVEVKKIRKKTSEKDPILDGDKLSIPGGMTIVVPMAEVYELLNSSALVEQRNGREILANQRRENNDIGMINADEMKA